VPCLTLVKCEINTTLKVDITLCFEGVGLVTDLEKNSPHCSLNPLDNLRIHLGVVPLNMASEFFISCVR